MIIPTVDSVDRPRAFGYDGYIDNILIRLGVTPQTPFEDLTADATPPRIDTSESAEDVRDEAGRRYSRSRLTGGAGLDFLHERSRPENADTRFWDSRRVDVFRRERGSIYEVPLMHRMDEEEVTGTPLSLLEHEGTAYYLKSDGLYDVASQTQQIALTSATKAVALGSSIYVLDGSGVGRIDPPTWTRNAISAVAYTDIWAVKSRVLGLDGTTLKDPIDTDATIMTVPAADTIHDVIDAGRVVLVLSSTGSIHSLTLNDALELVPTQETAFGQETPILAAEAFGVLGFVTTEPTEAGGNVARFYTGAVGSDGSVGDLQLRYSVGDRDSTDDLTPLAITATRDSIYVAIPEEGEDTLTLWRYYLPTSGYARAHEIDFTSASSCVGIVEIDDRMHAATDQDVFVESDLYEASGWAIGPAADFYTAENKQWVSGELSGAELPPNTALQLYDSTSVDLMAEPSSLDWNLVTQLTTGAAQARVESLTGRESRYHVAKITWASDPSGINSPRWRSYSFRALPNPVRDVLLRVPINVSDQIETKGRRATKIPGRGKATEEALRALEGQHTLIEIYRPAWKIRGMVERFEGTITTIPNRGSVRFVMYARIRGTAVSDFGEVSGPISNASWGNDQWGVPEFAQGEVNA